MSAIAGRPPQVADPPPFLVRLYPAVWRARYGAEFAELLLARPPKLRDRFDIVLGAIDARVNPQLDPNAARETRPTRDRSVGGLLVAGGILLVAWAGLGVTNAPRWNSGDVMAAPELLAAASTAGFIGAILITVALLLIASRYDWAIGAAGSVGAVLTGTGLVFSSLGGGPLALLLLVTGALLFAWRTRGRLVGTFSSVVIAVTTLLVAGAMVGFAAGGGQDVGILSVLLAFGPAWILVGLDLRAPIRQVQPVAF